MSVSITKSFSFCASDAAKLLLVVCCAALLASCSNSKRSNKPSQHINNETKFSSKEFGVKGSPRITTAKRVKKGGGRYQIGKPYTIRGRKYFPKEDPNYVKTGMASWYGPNFHGRLTANGEIYDQYSLSAAHPTMPLPSYAKVTNLENGSSVVVRVNDRGPFAHSRIIDLSARAAELLGYQRKGIAKVRVEYAGKARMDGLDEQVLMASYVPAGGGPARIIKKIGSQILLAGNSLQRKPLSDVELGQASTANSFVPVPQARPTTYQGIPMDIANYDGSVSTTFVSGYFPESQINSRIAQAFSVVGGFSDTPNAMTPPSQGMNDLIQLKIGPFENIHSLQQAEKLLENIGIVQRVRSADRSQQILLVITVREESVDLLEKISQAGIPLQSEEN